MTFRIWVAVVIAAGGLVAAETVPVTHWPLDGSVEGRLGSRAGQAHGVSFAEGARRAAVFAGDSYIAGQLRPAAPFDGGTFSIAAWVRPQGDFADGIHHYILALAKGEEFNHVMLRMVARRFQFVCRDPDKKWRYAYGPQTVAPDRWHHVVGVKCPAELRLYVDGRLMSCETTPRFEAADVDRFWIGAQSDLHKERFFQGQIDDVRVFGCALTDFDAMKLYAEADPQWSQIHAPRPPWGSTLPVRVMAYVAGPRRRWRRFPARLTLDLPAVLPTFRWPSFDAIPKVELYRMNGDVVKPVPCRVRRTYYEGCAVEVAWWHEGSAAAWYALYLGPETTRAASSLEVGDGEPLRHGTSGMVCELGDGANSVPMFIDCNGDGLRDLLVSYHLARHGKGLYVYRNPGRRANGIPLFSRGLRVRTLVAARPRMFTEDVRPPVVGFLGGTRDWPRTEFRLGALSFAPDAVTFEPRARIRMRDFQIGKERGGIIGAPADWDGDGAVDFLCYRGWNTKKGYWPDGLSPWRGVEVPNVGFGRGYDARGKWLGGVRHHQAFWCRNVGTDERPGFGPCRFFEVNGETLDIEGKQFCPAAADINGDGMLDLVASSGLDELIWFRNVGGPGSVKLAPPRNLLEGATSFRDSYSGSHLFPCDLDSDGELDWLVGGNPGLSIWLKRAADRRFRQMGPLRCVDGDLRVDTLAVPFMCDWNGDGRPDLIVGDSSGYVSLFRGLANPPALRFGPREKLRAGGEIIMVQAGYSGSIQGPGEARWGYVAPTVVDWDGDGDLDLLAGDIKGQNRWFENVGDRRRPRLAEPVELMCEGEPLRTVWRTRPTVWPRPRSLPDYVTLDHRGRLTLYARDTDGGAGALREGVQLRYADGDPIKLDGPSGHCGRIKLHGCDWDGDGTTDILYGMAGAQVRYSIPDAPTRKATVLWLRNAGGDPPSFDRPRLIMAHHRPIELGGHSTAPQAIDVDGDGSFDLIVGDENGKVYYFHRSVLDDAPLTLVARTEAANGHEKGAR